MVKANYGKGETETFTYDNWGRLMTATRGKHRASFQSNRPLSESIYYEYNDLQYIFRGAAGLLFFGIKKHEDYLCYRQPHVHGGNLFL